MASTSTVSFAPRLSAAAAEKAVEGDLETRVMPTVKASRRPPRAEPATVADTRIPAELEQNEGLVVNQMVNQLGNYRNQLGIKCQFMLKSIFFVVTHGESIVNEMGNDIKINLLHH